ncbi:hypothetical protein [Actinoalloteichus hymeniacidonis]|nr:hypothetical protein [Actinoalloteichus hymeniacidonis]MBB5910508.1 hypothetical protein [Actinoalloteichus hymeniacidonis]
MSTGGVSDQEEDVAAAFAPLLELPEPDELLDEPEEPEVLDVLDVEELLSVDFEVPESDFFSVDELDSDFTVEVAPSPLPLRLSVR